MKRNSLALVTLSVCAAASVAAAAESPSPSVATPVMFRGDAAHHGDYGPPAIRGLTLETGEQMTYEQRPGEPRNWDFYLSSPVTTVRFVRADDGAVERFELVYGDDVTPVARLR